MSYTIDCQNCSYKFNPNNHYECPKCEKRPDLVSVGGDSQEKQFRRQSSFGPLGWFLVVFIISAILGGLITMNRPQEAVNPNSGYEAEWNADNSIDEPSGSFDNQSKP
jgi:hypothetical protein